MQGFVKSTYNLVISELVVYAWSPTASPPNALVDLLSKCYSPTVQLLIILPDKMDPAYQAEIELMKATAAEQALTVYVFTHADLWKVYLLLVRGVTIRIASPGNYGIDTPVWIANVVGSMAASERVTSFLVDDYSSTGDEPQRILELALNNHETVVGIREFDAAFRLGVSKVLCLGRARMGIVLEVERDMVVSEHPEGIDLMPELTDFVVGRDGTWCLIGEKAGGGEELITCVHQQDLGMRLLIPKGSCLGKVRVRAELRSGLYTHTLARAAGAVEVTVDAVHDLEVEGWAWLETKAVPVWVPERFILCEV